METSIIIALCLLLLLAYIFDVSASKTKIPSVILLLIVGWSVRQSTAYFDVSVPNLLPLLPILGTVGLILIVLEGSLELELNGSKLRFVGRTAIIAFGGILVFSLGLAGALQYFGGVPFKTGLANAIPLGIISSAIAIPSVQNLRAAEREFITYESSLSDIFGVILFNFVVLNDTIDMASVGGFTLDIIIILVITFIAALGLSFLLSKITHHVKFVPIILMIVLIYYISKIYHLPALVFIFLFGLFLGNLDELRSIRFIQRLRPNILNKEVHKFKELIAEITFLIRVLFFLLFGYLIETSELLNTAALLWTVGIVLSLFMVRFLFLKIFKISLKPLLYIAPRGLITILLFLSIPTEMQIPLVNKSLIIQVIVLTALVMMLGIMNADPIPEEGEEIMDVAPLFEAESESAREGI